MSPLFSQAFVKASRSLHTLSTRRFADEEEREKRVARMEKIVDGLTERLARERGITLEPELVPFEELPFYPGEVVAFDDSSFGHVVFVPTVPRGFVPVKPSRPGEQAEWIPLEDIRSLV